MLGRSPNLCYLSITGDIPDSAGYAVLGQPFLRNYYTVLDQDRMRIGLAANIGTEAAISEKPFNSSVWVQVILGILGSIIVASFSFFIYKYTQKKLHNRKIFAQTSGLVVDGRKETSAAGNE